MTHYVSYVGVTVTAVQLICSREIGHNASPCIADLKYGMWSQARETYYRDARPPTVQGIIPSGNHIVNSEPRVDSGVDELERDSCVHGTPWLWASRNLRQPYRIWNMPMREGPPIYQLPKVLRAAELGKECQSNCFFCFAARQPGMAFTATPSYLQNARDLQRMGFLLVVYGGNGLLHAVACVHFFSALRAFIKGETVTKVSHGVNFTAWKINNCT